MSDYDNDQKEGKKQILRCHLCIHLITGTCSAKDCENFSCWAPRPDTCDTCVHGGEPHSDCDGCESAAGSFAKWASRCETCVFWNDAKCWNTDCCIPGSKDGDDRFEKLACLDCPFWKQEKCTTTDECKEENGLQKRLETIGADCSSCVSMNSDCRLGDTGLSFCTKWERMDSAVVDAEVDDTACMKPGEPYRIKYFIPLTAENKEKVSGESAQLSIEENRLELEKVAMSKKYNDQIKTIKSRVLELSKLRELGAPGDGLCSYQIENGEKVWRDENGNVVIKANSDGAPVQKPKKAPLTPEEKEQKKQERKAKRKQEKAEKEANEKLTGHERPLFQEEAQNA